MKKSFAKILALLLALMLVISISAAFADESATPTDLAENSQPAAPAAGPDGNDEQDAGNEGSENADTGNESNAKEPSGNAGNIAEVIVTKFVRLGDSWSGQVTGEKPALLKLDVTVPGTVWLTVESKQTVQAAVMESARPEDVLKKSRSDSRTGILSLSWEAKAGSYLIQISPEGAGGARVKALFLDEEQYALWEEEQAAATEQETPVESEPADESPEEVPAEQQDEQPEQEPDEQQEEVSEEQAEEPAQEQPVDELSEEQPEAPEFTLPENRSVHIDLTWDTDHPQIGDTAHFTSVMTGYDGLTYSLQWQTSWDGETWDDYPGATEPQLDVVLTEEMDGVLFSLVVYIEDARPAE